MSTNVDSVVIWGEVLWDRFPDGDQLGGAPANVAWHIAQAGGWARLVTRIGDDDDGRRALDRMAEAEVDTDLVQIDPERATGEVTVRVEHGEPRYALQPGRAWERIACTQAVRDALADGGIFVYGTLAQRSAEGLEAWQQAAASATGLRVCDLNLRPGDTPGAAITAGLAVADLVKLNDRELAWLREAFGWRDPIAALRERARIVAVTHGADGSTLHGAHGALAIAGLPAAPGGDNVGCGDSYLAILVHGLTCGWDLESSGRAASRWAAAVASARGATPVFDDERIAELLGTT